MKSNLLKGGIILIIFMTIILGVLTSCSTSTNSTTTITATVVATVTATQTVNTEYDINLSVNNVDGDATITDRYGRTLYYNIADTLNSSTVTNPTILANWPVFYEANIKVVPLGLNEGYFSAITRTDGAKQTTYAGWPLYYYVNDKVPGDAKGYNIGGVWYAAEPFAMELGSNAY
jgi:predicted lipoprotein with Yx(FWY)xxD motif